MDVKKPLVVIGLLGPTLDAGARDSRWERWRPSVAACQHPDLPVARFELLHQDSHLALARTVQGDIATVSPDTAVRLCPIEWRDPWDFEEVYGVLHDFARRYPFDSEREDYLVHITTGSHVAQICLFLLTESRHLPARLLQTSPPARGVRGEGPAELRGTWRAIDLDLSRYDRLAARFAAEARARTGLLKAGIETRNADFNALIDRVERVALASTAPILLTGETGTGKTQLARRIYELKFASRQVAGAFVEVNCATLRGDATMATLFGHARGAFTGAVGEREGLLRQAHKGVAFLDEIGDLGLDEQAMLLRAIEDRRFRPMGSDREVESDFQLLAGTHRDLAARVAEGRFREDLLARIELWTFRLPGLRERPEDIEPNLDFELEASGRRLGVRASFNREARERFVAFAVSPEARWTSNFRDFSAAVTRLATLSRGGRIDMAAVEEEIARLRARWRAVRREEGSPAAVTPAATAVTAVTAVTAATAATDDDALVRAVLGAEGADALDRFDRPQLAEVIRVCRASPTLSAAGRELFARSRAGRTSFNDSDRLRKYLARLGLTWERVSRRTGGA